MAKELSLAYLLIIGKRRDRLMHFQKVLAQIQKQFHPEFEPGPPIPFPMTITIMLNTPPFYLNK